MLWYEREIESLYQEVSNQQREIAALKDELAQVRKWGREALAILNQWEHPNATKIVRQMKRKAPKGITR